MEVSWRRESVSPTRVDQIRHRRGHQAQVDWLWLKTTRCSCSRWQHGIRRLLIRERAVARGGRFLRSEIDFYNRVVRETSLVFASSMPVIMRSGDRQEASAAIQGAQRVGDDREHWNL